MTIFISVLILGFLVVIHELGHCIAAKRAGVLVEEFGVGFPPRLFSVKRGETVYSFNLLPLGGFVKIYGETEEFKDNPRSFASKNIGVRTGIVFAGVFMNFIIGMLLLVVSYSIGFPSPVVNENEAFIQNQSLTIVRVLPNTPAMNAGLRDGDVITALNGKGVDATGFREFVNDHKGNGVAITIERAGEKKMIFVATRKEYPANEGSVGIALVDQGMLRYPLHLAVVHGVKDSFVIVGKIVAAFAGLLSGILHGAVNRDAVSGPVGVFVLAGHAIQSGIRYVLPLIILITFNLAVMNVLPLPALDGGRIFFFILEKIKGKPVSSKIENIIHGTGFVLLIVLMLFLTVGDIKRFF
ncbi:MAG: site-2 protease family protein [Parcubacteria group bacterium]|nr:site-2 protease family protein [Parcubacteria group bacterium]